MNVYFISGMCYNCSVFDGISLPDGFEKRYIEWIIPEKDMSLFEYTLLMGRSIDTSKPFVLVGYSFGAVIMQELNTIMCPEKSVVISSFKAESEIPTLFQVAKKGRLVGRVPDRLFARTEFVNNAFNKLVYKVPTEELADYMTVTDPIYVKWAVEQITNWVPDCNCRNLYHIHGTKDQIFPHDKIKNARMISGGDHLMVSKMAGDVSVILADILSI